MIASGPHENLSALKNYIIPKSVTVINLDCVVVESDDSKTKLQPLNGSDPLEGDIFNLLTISLQELTVLKMPAPLDEFKEKKIIISGDAKPDEEGVWQGRVQHLGGGDPFSITLESLVSELRQVRAL